MTEGLDDAELRDEFSTIKNMMAELLARIDPPEESGQSNELQNASNAQ